MSGNYKGTQSLGDANSEFAAQNAAIRRIINMMGPNLPVKVLSVSGTGLNPVGYVTVQPLVHQIDGRGHPTPRGIIHNVPYVRIQGGSRAIICDPQEGDIGYIIVSGRDISTVKAARGEAAPGSFRTHDCADAVYVGGLLNAAPEEYIGWVDGDVHVKTAGKFIVDAEEMQVNCAITASGDVTAGSISLQNHTHPGVQAGSSSTGAPQG